MNNRYSLKRQRQFGYHCAVCLSPSIYNYRTNSVKCINCGDNMSYISNVIPKSYVEQPFYKIGIEMEGGWKDRPKGDIIGEVVFHSDGSVHLEEDDDGYWSEDGGCRCSCYCDEYEDDDDDCDYCASDGECQGCDRDRSHNISGEYVTTPNKIDEFIMGSNSKFEKIVTENYPTKTNITCGGHFHLSVKHPFLWGIIANKELWISLKKALSKWGKKHLSDAGYKNLMARIKGERQYCVNAWYGEQQLSRENTDRYTHLNFCVDRHGTMEIRILPMFQYAKTYIKAVKYIINYIIKWV